MCAWIPGNNSVTASIVRSACRGALSARASIGCASSTAVPLPGARSALPCACRAIYDPRHVNRIDELSAGEWQVLAKDLWRAQVALMRTVQCEHINLAVLGNEVPHLHWHLIPRSRTMVMGAPIWRAGSAAAAQGRGFCLRAGTRRSRPGSMLRSTPRQRQINCRSDARAAERRGWRAAGRCGGTPASRRRRIVLAVSALPEQEARQPHLAAGADDQIRIGMPAI